MAGITGQSPNTGAGAPFPEQLVIGTSDSGTAVSGSANTGAGVLGVSIGPPAPAGGEVVPHPLPPGPGVHGVSGKTSGFTPAQPCGAWGESSTGYGVVGSSATAHGVQGVNGAGSGKSPQFGAGVWGDSENGIGVFGASKHSNAGEFDGNVSMTGKVTVTGDVSMTGKVTVTGDVSVTGNQTVTGDHTVKGNIAASDVILSGADCAEEFDIACVGDIEAGMVVVFDEGGGLRPGVTPYDKRVAGVISGAGSFKPGVILDRRVSKQPRLPVALVGKVYCKVDASYAPIEVGDPLTSSATPGFAMKASDPASAFGAVIGKALASLGSGHGLIPILVSLR